MDAMTRLETHRPHRVNTDRAEEERMTMSEIVTQNPPESQDPKYHWSCLRFHEGLLRFVNFLNTSKTAMYVGEDVVRKTVTAARMNRRLSFFLAGYRFRHFGLAQWGAD